ncbi:hypothetical protein WMY93_019062 [Mugilogobius chulae]|uniref:XK-related protein n=1 Tax=Mugilogobius chulae TaxID=88201 RepID=A0AAW0NIP0_9GOBI
MEFRAFRGKNPYPKSEVVSLSFDSEVLGIVEVFSEHLPQLVFMLTTIIQKGHADAMPVLKAFCSAAVIQYNLIRSHHFLLQTIDCKFSRSFVSSAVCFLWNLFLIAARVTALCLFASVLSYYIAVHFLCSWIVFFIIVWCCKTNAMKSRGGEVLYRGTVALIWHYDAVVIKEELKRENKDKATEEEFEKSSVSKDTEATETPMGNPEEKQNERREMMLRPVADALAAESGMDDRVGYC